MILQADQLLGAPESIWTIIMVPFTTQKLERAVLPTHHRVTSCGPGTPFTEPSMAMCHQVRALDSVRFRDYLGMLGGDDFKQIIAGVLYSIGLKMKQ